MASFGQHAFALGERQDRSTTDAANRARRQQFTMWVDPYEATTLPPANPTGSTSKRPLTDITATANNGNPPKRQRGRPKGSTNGPRAPPVNAAAPYNPTPPEPVVVRSRQEIRRSERLASRAPPASQPLPQEDDDDDDFDLPPARPYTGLYDHDSDSGSEDETGAISPSRQAEQRSAQRQRSNDIRGSTRRVRAGGRVRARPRVRRSGPRNTRDGILRKDSDMLQAMICGQDAFVD
ncbi:MAG: hypothetical protein Q9223_007972 [Gallowayella weberi]